MAGTERKGLARLRRFSFAAARPVSADGCPKEARVKHLSPSPGVSRGPGVEFRSQAWRAPGRPQEAKRIDDRS